MTTETRRLRFGYNQGIPGNVEAAWGARLIFPDDLLYDRQDSFGTDEAVVALHAWLNSGPLKAALEEARRLGSTFELRQNDDREVTLYEDSEGVILGNPNGSYGYLYIAAFKR